jgi:glycosyltransferase involved in cell wall biosynthesis
MVVHAYYPLGETRVEREALALIDHGYEVDVICLRDDAEPAVDSDNGVTIYRLPVKRHKMHGRFIQLLEYLAFFILALGKLMVLHRRKRYGTVQAHNLPDFLIFAGLWPKLSRARLILDIHDLMPEFYAALSNGNMSSWPVRLLSWQEKLSCRFADQVITVTDIWKTTLIKRGVSAKKVSVVMNVADDRIFYRDPNTEPAGNNTDQFKLIYHGTFTHRYGVDLIIRAVDKVRREIPGIRLTLLGSGETREDLVRLTETLNLQEHVHISSQVVHVSNLPQMIRQADVGIVPNRSDIFTDGLLPTKLMEYVALGTPVIAARTPTIASYFDETMIQFFEPGNADDLAKCILTLHADRSRLAQFVQNADTFNQKYSWPQVAENYVALVEQAVNGR